MWRTGDDACKEGVTCGVGTATMRLRVIPGTWADQAEDHYTDWFVFHLNQHLPQLRLGHPPTIYLS